MLCDCHNCENEGVWRQEFKDNGESKVVRLCSEHHFILRNKVKHYNEFDFKVLEWLLEQPNNRHKVVQYGIIIGV